MRHDDNSRPGGRRLRRGRPVRGAGRRRARGARVLSPRARCCLARAPGRRADRRGARRRRCAGAARRRHLAVGAGLNDAPPCDVLVNDGRRAVQRAAAPAACPSRRAEHPDLGLEAGHGRRRILHAGGGATGAAVTQRAAGPRRRAPAHPHPCRIRPAERAAQRRGARVVGVRSGGDRLSWPRGGPGHRRLRRAVGAHDQPAREPRRGPGAGLGRPAPAWPTWSSCSSTRPRWRCPAGRPICSARRCAARARCWWTPTGAPMVDPLLAARRRRPRRRPPPARARPGLPLPAPPRPGDFVRALPEPRRANCASGGSTWPATCCRWRRRPTTAWAACAPTPGPHRRARPVRGGRGGLHRRAGRQPPGLELAAGVPGLRPARRPGRPRPMRRGRRAAWQTEPLPLPTPDPAREHGPHARRGARSGRAACSARGWTATWASSAMRARLDDAGRRSARARVATGAATCWWPRWSPAPRCCAARAAARTIRTDAPATEPALARPHPLAPRHAHPHFEEDRIMTMTPYAAPTVPPRLCAERRRRRHRAPGAGRGHRPRRPDHRSDRAARRSAPAEILQKPPGVRLRPAGGRARLRRARPARATVRLAEEGSLGRARACVARIEGPAARHPDRRAHRAQLPAAPVRRGHRRAAARRAGGRAPAPR